MEEYLNKFNLTDELAEAITRIINENESEEYVCKAVSFRLTSKDNRKGHPYFFLIVIDKALESILLNGTYDSCEDLDKALFDLCEFYLNYDGLFDSKKICLKFPYLKSLFNELDKWRLTNNRVTIDHEVLNRALNSALCSNVHSYYVSVEETSSIGSI